jgi:peroxiredoxin Q/BCP
MASPSVATEGAPAPDFTLPSTKHGDVTLSKLRGKKVLIAFYPRDFTGG